MSEYKYTPTTWIGGKTIGTADVMNNIEDGIVKAHERLDNIGDINGVSNNTLCITPEQFGAVGDGVTDDLNAFISMFNYMIENASDIDVGETSVKDFGKYEILFTGKYAISDTFTLLNCYNLKIDRLNLVATNNFNGECLIKLTGITRNINFSNCIFDGNEYKASCLLMDEECSDLNIKFTDCNFRRFKAYGLKNIGTGHEMLINNCKINQYDWGCEGYPPGGIGLYIGAESHDHQIMNTIICYCSENLFINYGGSCFVNSAHFYGPKVSIIGGYTFFNNCYFDSTCLEINGFNSVKNCFFLSGEENYFIKLTDTAENSWTYSLTDIIGNRFNANTSAITTPIVSDNIDISTLSINIYDNLFYNVTPICSKSEHVYNPSPYPTIWSGTQAEYDSIEWKDDHTLYLIREE